MKKQIIMAILNSLLIALKSDALKPVLDAMIDKIEEIVTKTPNKIDDMIVLPGCRQLRKLLDLPDNDEIN